MRIEGRREPALSSVNSSVEQCRFGHSKIWRALLVCSVALGLSGCGDRFPDYRYKMTVHVGDKAFSSVRGIEQEEINSMQSSSGRTVKRTLTGEAVIIEVNKQTYYALLTRPDNADYATLIAGAALGPAMPTVAPPSAQDAAIKEWRSDQGERDPTAYLDDMAARSRAMTEVKGAHPLPRTLPPRQGRPPFQAWPMFVTFDDPKDPKTVREVSPDNIGINNITIEITDEDVTTGIEKRLGWLAGNYDRMLDGNRLHVSNALSNTLGRQAFKLESAK